MLQKYIWHVVYFVFGYDSILTSYLQCNFQVNKLFFIFGSEQKTHTKWRYMSDKQSRACRGTRLLLVHQKAGQCCPHPGISCRHWFLHLGGYSATNTITRALFLKYKMFHPVLLYPTKSTFTTVTVIAKIQEMPQSSFYDTSRFVSLAYENWGIHLSYVYNERISVDLKFKIMHVNINMTVYFTSLRLTLYMHFLNIKHVRNRL